MTVSDLQTLLAEANPKAIIVSPIRDHQYREAKANICTAIDDKEGLLEDFYPDDDEPPYGKRIPVVVIV